MEQFSVQSSVDHRIFAGLFIQTLSLFYWALNKQFSGGLETRVVVCCITDDDDDDKEGEEEEAGAHHRFGNKRWRLMIIFHTLTPFSR
jgi:hypothetical protein